jgi:hypothetical protein
MDVYIKTRKFENLKEPSLEVSKIYKISLDNLIYIVYIIM